MTNRGAATRYARALFDTVLAEGLDLQQTQKDLGEFAGLVAGNDALQRVLTNPAIPVARKRGVIERAPSCPRRSLQPTVAKLLLMLAERDRLVILPDVADVFDARLMEHQNVVRARIVTAVALPSGPRHRARRWPHARDGPQRGDRNAGGSGDHRWRRGAHRRHGLRRQHHAAARADTRNARRRDRLAPKRAARPSAARSRRARRSGAGASRATEKCRPEAHRRT